MKKEAIGTLSVWGRLRLDWQPQGFHHMRTFALRKGLIGQATILARVRVLLGQQPGYNLITSSSLVGRQFLTLE